MLDWQTRPGEIVAHFRSRPSRCCLIKRLLAADRDIEAVNEMELGRQAWKSSRKIPTGAAAVAQNGRDPFVRQLAI